MIVRRVAELVDAVRRRVGRTREALEAAIERFAAQLDQPVGVEDERGTRSERRRPFREDGIVDAITEVYAESVA